MLCDPTAATPWSSLGSHELPGSSVYSDTRMSEDMGFVFVTKYRASTRNGTAEDRPKQPLSCDTVIEYSKLY